MRHFIVSLLLGFFVIVFAGCGSESYEFRPCSDTVTAVYDKTASDSSLTGGSWLYQLQGGSPAAIAASSFDIVVMDYSSDGSADGVFSSAEMATIKNSGKTVLAYFSIGEAEDYRYYFNESWLDGSQPGENAPCWLNRTNPEWEGNYKVQYWSEAWQKVLIAYLDIIIDQGFDGVYLDIIDAWEYWSDSDNGEGYSITEEEAAGRMINLVKRLAYYARVTRGETSFFIIPQNGEVILDYDTGVDGNGADDYIATIDGIGIEDLYYDETTAIDSEITAARKAYLDDIKDYPAPDSKTILVVDYVDRGDQSDPVTAFITAAEGDGYLPYAAMTDRGLDEINSFTGQP